MLLCFHISSTFNFYLTMTIRFLFQISNMKYTTTTLNSLKNQQNLKYYDESKLVQTKIEIISVFRTIVSLLPKKISLFIASRESKILTKSSLEILISLGSWGAFFLLVLSFEENKIPRIWYLQS